ncbi:MAG TPA: flagellin [Candidatus Baltobacteraceae bacterium]|nr:flagellin [Candidatus Baltobacteraceae bacterium]
MDVLGGTNRVELNLGRTLFDQGRQVNALASGLRVNSAVDDPSGLAIAATLQSRIGGLQAGVQNVQTAGSLLNTADGVLSTVESILTRVHTLIVEAGSDMNSDSDLQNIQSQLNSLLLEINKISAGAKFNGVALFDGSHDGTLGLETSPQAVQIRASLNPDGSIPTDTLANAGDPVNDPNNKLIYQQNGVVPLNIGSANGYIQGLSELQITAIDPVNGIATVRDIQYSTQSGFDNNSAVTEQIAPQTISTNAGPISGQLTAPNAMYPMLQIALGNVSNTDVGVAMAFETFDPTNTTGVPTGQSIEINTTGVEGDTVKVNLPGLSTSVLQVSGISILRPQEVDVNDNLVGTDSSNQFAVMDAEARVNHAIDLVNQIRADVGAQSVSLQTDADNSSTAVVNLVASESSIRDVDVGTATTAFMKDQILQNIDLSVMSQMHVDAQLVAQLVVRASTA